MPERLRHGAVAVGILLLMGVVATGLLLNSGPAPDRAYELQQRLRCPVCSTVSIAESQSDTAIAMRTTIEEQIAAGRSDAEIIAYFTDRYGGWVLMDPPASGSTLPLWLIPLAAAAAGILFVATRRRPVAAPAELDDADRRRVAEAVARLQRSPADEDGL